MDKDILAKKLAILSADSESFENGLRVIADGDVPGPLTAILSEVDMTVLPRGLKFRMNQSEITLVAGGRRLRGLARDSKDIKGVTGVLGKPLSQEDPELLAGLRGILEQFAATTGRLTVESGEPEVMGGQTDAGVSADALAQLWDVSLGQEPQGGMDGFVRDCGGLATAWLILSDDAETTSGGDGAKLEALKNALAEKWETFSQSVAQLTGDRGFVCLNNALGEAGSVAIATEGKEAILICYESGDMAALHSLWAQS